MRVRLSGARASQHDLRKSRILPLLTSITTAIKSPLFLWDRFAYANKEVCPSYIAAKSHPYKHILLQPLLLSTMANFSVECLARSYYEEMTPRTKDAALHSRNLSEIVEFTKESRSRYSATSPNSKFTDKPFVLRAAVDRAFVCVLIFD